MLITSTNRSFATLGMWNFGAFWSVHGCRSRPVHGNPPVQYFIPSIRAGQSTIHASKLKDPAISSPATGSRSMADYDYQSYPVSKHAFCFLICRGFHQRCFTIMHFILHSRKQLMFAVSILVHTKQGYASPTGQNFCFVLWFRFRIFSLSENEWEWVLIENSPSEA